MRRRRPERREILPDPMYHDLAAAKFVNYITGKGKKGVAERLEDLVRDIIKKMIYFSQFPENEILSHEKLTEQIDNLLLNRNLWEEYKKNI